MASPTRSPQQNQLSDWTLAEKIRLLELYTDREKDMLWEERSEVLQQEFAKRRPPDFFNISNVRRELHRIFSKPNPEHHICGMPVHPRGKEAAELWLKHFRKEYTELLERKKQMFAVAIRRHMDLIYRYQQGKVSAEEMEAILAEQREKDAERTDSEIYEAKIKEAIDKLDPDGLKNIRSTGDYINYVRGERIPSPLPIQSRFDQQIPTLTSPTRSFGSPEPVLKGFVSRLRTGKTPTRLEMAVQKILRKKSESLGKNGGEVEIIEGDREKRESGKINSGLRRSHSWANLDIQNSAKEDELPSIDILVESTGTEQSKYEPEAKKEEIAEEERILKEEMVELCSQLQNQRLEDIANMESCAKIILPRPEWAFARLDTQESILTKTNQNFTFSKQIGANEEEGNSAHFVFGAPNIMEPIEMTIQMPLAPKAKSPIKTIPVATTSASLSPPPQPTFTISPPKMGDEEEAEERRQPSPALAETPSIITRGREKRRSTSSGTAEKQKEATIEKIRQKQWAQGRQEVQEASANMGRERRTSLRRNATPKQEEGTMEEEQMAIQLQTPNVPKSRKRKRGELDLLTTAASGVGEQQIPPEGSPEAGPPSRNLRRTSHQLSPVPPAPATSSSSTSPSSTQPTANAVPIPVQSPKPEPVDEPPIIPPIIPEEILHEPPILSRIAINTKMRSSLRRAALATATPSPAVDSVGENGLFLRPGNHTSHEIIPRQVLLTLWNDIRTHRYAYVFDQPVSEEEVPGYHLAIKKPMDLKTLRARIESGAVQTFGQFSHYIFLMFANACMYNSTGHHVNSYAKDMLAYALRCLQVVQYPDGMWAQTHPLGIGTVGGGTGSRQSNASGSEAGDGRISRSSTTTTSTNATKSTSQPAAAQRTNRRSAGTNSGIWAELGGNEQRKNSSASISAAIKQELDDSQQSSSTASTKVMTRSGGSIEGEEGANSSSRRRTSQRKH